LFVTTFCVTSRSTARFEIEQRKARTGITRP
jgi:hypothetical protein